MPRNTLSRTVVARRLATLLTPLNPPVLVGTPKPLVLLKKEGLPLCTPPFLNGLVVTSLGSVRDSVNMLHVNYAMSGNCPV